MEFCDRTETPNWLLGRIKENIMARGRGSCGGTRRKDGSGGGNGNRGTAKQPRKKR